MISSEVSRMNSGHAVDVCPTCQGPLSLRSEFGYPVRTQIAFAASFAAFLIWSDRIRAMNYGRWMLGVWAALQAVLGFFLIRNRLRARRRIYRCIRCTRTVR